MVLIQLLSLHAIPTHTHPRREQHAQPPSTVADAAFDQSGVALSVPGGSIIGAWRAAVCITITLAGITEFFFSMYRML